MRKPILFAILFVMVLASVAAILQSGWTGTTVPSVARTALGASGITNNNIFTGSNNFSGGLSVLNPTFTNPTNIAAGLTIVPAELATLDGIVTTSNIQSQLDGKASLGSGTGMQTNQFTTNTPGTGVSGNVSFSNGVAIAGVLGVGMITNPPITTLIGPILIQNTSAATNGQYSDATGHNHTNAVGGVKLSGGTIAITNFQTGNWSFETNGINTRGTTNNSTPKITQDGTTGGTTNTGLIQAAGIRSTAGSVFTSVSFGSPAGVLSSDGGISVPYANSAYYGFYFSGGSPYLSSVSTQQRKLIINDTAALYGDIYGVFLGGIQSTNIQLKVESGATPKLKIMSGNTNTADFVVSGAGSLTNGVASYATNTVIALAATGVTNTLGINGTAYVTATAVSFTINNRANAVLYTSPTLTATLPVHLQPAWSIQAASGLAGSLLPD